MDYDALEEEPDAPEDEGNVDAAIEACLAQTAGETKRLAGDPNEGAELIPWAPDHAQLI